MSREYAPVFYWWHVCLNWCERGQWDEFGYWLSNKNDELTLGVLKFSHCLVLIHCCQFGQQYSDGLLHLILRIVHRNPSCLTIANDDGLSVAEFAELSNTCEEVRNVLARSVQYFAEASFSTLLRQFFKYNPGIDLYNAICKFVIHVIANKAEMASLAPRQNCAVCNNKASMYCSRCKVTFYCCAEHQKNDWKTHKKSCSAPSVRKQLQQLQLHSGIGLLMRLVQEVGGGGDESSSPTPAVIILRFLFVNSN
ncbi:hypothetical protein ScalyP_jg7330 [Parmales sp. scaly parma]|nr:hypothetical protein ScalyP_jg7330 [Parmales sp. scaly parma]